MMGGERNPIGENYGKLEIKCPNLIETEIRENGSGN